MSVTLLATEQHQDAEQLARSYLHGQQQTESATLIAMLDEAHPLYQGLGSDAVVRVRGALMLTLARHHQCQTSFHYFIEELEIPHNAYLIAVAAHCITSTQQRSPKLLDALLHALRFVQLNDDIIRLAEYGGQGRQQPTTTACIEIFKCLAWLNVDATPALATLKQWRIKFALSPAKQELDHTIALLEQALAEKTRNAPTQSCCATQQQASQDRPALQSILNTRFEDQHGEHLSYKQFLCGQPSLVVFFYTRCENELKCPVTIRKLGELQSALQQLELDKKIHTAAISYDPVYDTPARLEQYRRSAGAKSSPQFRMLRSLDDFTIIRDYFQLGVSYGSATVNRHRLEAYVLNTNGEIAYESTRVSWTVDEMVKQLVTQLD